MSGKGLTVLLFDLAPMFWLFLISVFVLILCPAPLTFAVMGLFWLIGEVANAFR